VLEVLYHHAKFGEARISLAAGAAKNVEFLPAALRPAHYPLPSNRHHRSNDDCLEGKRENYQVCSVQYSVQNKPIKTKFQVKVYRGVCYSMPNLALI